VKVNEQDFNSLRSLFVSIQITARVKPSNEILKCPVTGKNCMHYHIVAEELVATGKDDNDKPIKQWVYRFSESKSVDFFLADPQSSELTVFVPGKNIEIKRHVIMEGDTIDDPTKLVFSQNESIPKGIQAIATAKKFNLYQPSGLFHFVRRAKKEIRYSLFSIEMNEQIAMLAVVVDRRRLDGIKGKTLSPVRFNKENEIHCISHADHGFLSRANHSPST
jgi:hypothetical protein